MVLSNWIFNQNIPLISRQQEFAVMPAGLTLEG
jgi:hypothetical protein